MKMNKFTSGQLKLAVEICLNYELGGASFDLQKEYERTLIEEKEQHELDKWTEYTLQECPTYEAFLEWAEELLDDQIREETPHGECGDDISGYFRWDSREWLVTYEPDWDRHDKQFYYIDNWGSDHTTAVELNNEI